MPSKEHSKGRTSHDIAIVGELDDCESDVIARLLELEDGAECTIYIDSGGGRVYSAMAIVSLMLLKELRARAVVLGACSSAALLILAGCRARFAMPYSVFQFHPVRWESGENVEQVEATEWARHFGWLEDRCDEMLSRLLGIELSQIQKWSRSSRYLSGQELADAGIVQLIDPIKPVRTKSRDR
jgi:ATP-dependent Clp protease protease subunit